MQRFRKPFAAAIVFCAVSTVYGQAAAPAGSVDTLPPQLRDQGAAVLAATSDTDRIKAIDTINKADAAGSKTFLIGLLSTDASPAVRSAVLDRLGRIHDADVTTTLQRIATSDPDAEVSLKAIELYRARIMADARKLVVQRLDMAREQKDEKGLALLAKEEERWVSLVRGSMLPSFMQIPPAVFAVKPASASIRVLAFGDFGTGKGEQREVAEAMRKYHATKPFDFGLTLGDNFYSKGMEGPDDPRWKTWWADMYEPLGIPIYASLGNHDWGFAQSPAAEVLYTEKSKSWRMPATYYTYTAGPVQFFAIDTTEVSEAELRWLDQEITKSNARWKLVYAHHPIYSAGRHSDNPVLIKRLLPVLKGRVDVYLAGHDHDLQGLRAEDGVHFYVSGGGGAGLRKPEPGERSLFARGIHGFSVLEANDKSFTIRFIDTGMNEVYSDTITK